MYIVESERVHCQRKDQFGDCEYGQLFWVLSWNWEEEFAGSRKDSQNRWEWCLFKGVAMSTCLLTIQQARRGWCLIKREGVIEETGKRRRKGFYSPWTNRVFSERRCGTWGRLFAVGSSLIMRLIKDSEGRYLAEVALWGGRLEAEMRGIKLE